MIVTRCKEESDDEDVNNMIFQIKQDKVMIREHVKQGNDTIVQVGS